MKERNLKITGDLWVEILKNRRPQHFQVAKNGLPEDAKCVGLDYHRPPGDGAPVTLILKITSSVFRDDDPDDLPAPTIKAIEPQ